LRPDQALRPLKYGLERIDDPGRPLITSKPGSSLSSCGLPNAGQGPLTHVTGGDPAFRLPSKSWSVQPWPRGPPRSSRPRSRYSGKCSVGPSSISFAFKFYVTNVANDTATYGTIGGVIVTMLWFCLSGLAILIGAELNGVIEDAWRATPTESTMR
jgi:hypothetical protein